MIDINLHLDMSKQFGSVEFCDSRSDNQPLNFWVNFEYRGTAITFFCCANEQAARDLHQALVSLGCTMSGRKRPRYESEGHAAASNASRQAPRSGDGHPASM